MNVLTCNQINKQLDELKKNSECSKNPLETWLKEFVELKCDENLMNIATTTLYEASEKWIYENLMTHENNLKAFSLKLKQLNLKGLSHGIRGNKESTYLLNIPVLIEELNIEIN